MWPLVINQAQFSKFVHKIAHAGTRRTDHLRERLLADLGDDWLRSIRVDEVAELPKLAQ